jgi:DNA-binding MarR family transcriptional regulator
MVDHEQLAKALAAIGCPVERVGEMADQLEKRAGQLAAERGMTRDEATMHLLKLMSQGWAAKERGI